MVIWTTLKTYNMNKLKVFLGFLTGVSSGIVLGFLFTPNGADATAMEKISRENENYLSKIEGKLEKLIDSNNIGI